MIIMHIICNGIHVNTLQKVKPFLVGDDVAKRMFDEAHIEQSIIFFYISIISLINYAFKKRKFCILKSTRNCNALKL